MNGPFEAGAYSQKLDKSDCWQLLCLNVAFSLEPQEPTTTSKSSKRKGLGASSKSLERRASLTVAILDTPASSASPTIPMTSRKCGSSRAGPDCVTSHSTECSRPSSACLGRSATARPVSRPALRLVLSSRSTRWSAGAPCTTFSIKLVPETAKPTSCLASLAS